MIILIQLIWYDLTLGVKIAAYIDAIGTSEMLANPPNFPYFG